MRFLISIFVGLSLMSHGHHVEALFLIYLGYCASSENNRR